jgi:hypothetical protein
VKYRVKQGFSFTLLFLLVVLLSEWAAVIIEAPEGALRFRRLEGLNAAPPAEVLNSFPFSGSSLP